MKSKINLQQIVCKILVIIIFSSFIISCEKDYPDDIPDWIKEHIRETKKYDNYYSTISGAIFEIEEWEKDGIKIYSYHYTYDRPHITFYNCDGNELCVKDAECWQSKGVIDESMCPDGCDIVGYKYSRLIFNSCDYAHYQ